MKRREDSEAREKEERNDLAYDFLYVDYGRICAFLNRMDGLKSLDKSGETLSTERQRELHGSGGVPLIAKGDIDYQRRNTESKTFEYNVYWHNVFTFLDELNDINKDKKSHRLNEIAVIRGKISILDTGMMTSFLNKMAGSGIEQEGFFAIAAAGIDILKGIFCSISGRGSNYWCTLNKNDILSDPFSLMVKYGICIGNDWICVAIIDSIPTDPELKHSRIIGAKMDLENAFEEAIKEIRAVAGKPKGFIGITPLLIFRKVSGS